MLEYNEERHEYILDGKVIPSVTQLAKKFSGMDTTWLEQHPEFAERGTEIHNELAAYYKYEDIELSDQAKRLACFVPKKPTVQAETLLLNKTKEYAGTADIVIIEDKKCRAIIDFKTGTSGNKKYFACQLNLYRLALEDMGVDCSEIRLCIINPNGVFEFPILSWEEMENMIKDDYKPDEETSAKISELEDLLKNLEQYVQKYEETKEELKNLLQQKFAETKTGKYTGCLYSYSFVPESVRNSFDQVKAKELLGERASECVKGIKYKETIKFTKIGA